MGILEKELCWLGPILDCSGYASAARGYLIAADRVGIKIKASDRGRSINLKDKGMDEKIYSLYNRLSITKVSPGCPTVQHQVPDQFFEDKKSKIRIGYTIFEMCQIPKSWVPHCNKVDVIWTGSNYSKASFLSSGVKIPIKVLPHAIDLDLYNVNAEPWKIDNKRGFSFISIFDFNERKAWKDLLRAYWYAFNKNDDVCLILKVFFGTFSEQSIKSIINKIMNYRDELKITNFAPILIYGYDIPNAQMPGLYRSADCYVGISREGFGLSYCEAMACGIPCIGPEIGGNREFMTEENSYLIKYIGDERIGKETSRMYPDFSGLMWSRHSWEHLSDIMKKVILNKDERTKKTKQGMMDVHRLLSPEEIGKKIYCLI